MAGPQRQGTRAFYRSLPLVVKGGGEPQTAEFLIPLHLLADRSPSAADMKFLHHPRQTRL